MRLSITDDNPIFASNLLRIGEGKINLINVSEIKLPIGIIVETSDELINMYIMILIRIVMISVGYQIELYLLLKIKW